MPANSRWPRNEYSYPPASAFSPGRSVSACGRTPTLVSSGGPAGPAPRPPPPLGDPPPHTAAAPPRLAPRQPPLLLARGLARADGERPPARQGDQPAVVGELVVAQDVGQDQRPVQQDISGPVAHYHVRGGQRAGQGHRLAEDDVTAGQVAHLNVGAKTEVGRLVEAVAAVAAGRGDG